MLRLVLLLLYLVDCGALLGKVSSLLDRVRRAPRPDEILLPKVRDVPSDGHLAFIATKANNATVTSEAAQDQESPNFGALAESLTEARTWLEMTGSASADQLQDVLSSNDQLQNVLDSCRSLIAHAEAQQQQLALDWGQSASQEVHTLVGAVGSGYTRLLPFVARREDLPVEMLVDAVETQAIHSSRLGTFMQLIVKIDNANMRTVRTAWELHGKPADLRTLLEAEVAAGVQEPTRLAEGSAALSLLWSMRMKRFWTSMADGFADTSSTEATSAFGIRAYEQEVEPYHAFVLRGTFRTALYALPSREAMLTNMGMTPLPISKDETATTDSAESANAMGAVEVGGTSGAELTPEERRAACLSELRQCSEATRKVTDHVQALLDELGLHDDRRL